MDNDELRRHILHTFDPDDLVNALELDIEVLVELLWSEILENREKLYYITEDA